MCCYVPCIEPGPLYIYKLIWYIISLWREREARTEAGRLVLVISSFLTVWRKFLMYSRHHLSFGDCMWLRISSPILWAVLLLMLKLYAGEEGDDRGWDGWMASLTRWTWIWVNSGSSWWTGRPGGHDWVTELNWTEAIFSLNFLCSSLIDFLSKCPF